MAPNLGAILSNDWASSLGAPRIKPNHCGGPGPLHHGPNHYGGPCTPCTGARGPKHQALGVLLPNRPTCRPFNIKTKKKKGHSKKKRIRRQGPLRRTVGTVPTVLYLYVQ